MQQVSKDQSNKKARYRIAVSYFSFDNDAISYL
jgi:hypothetical protein